MPTYQWGDGDPATRGGVMCQVLDDGAEAWVPIACRESGSRMEAPFFRKKCLRPMPSCCSIAPTGTLIAADQSQIRNGKFPTFCRGWDKPLDKSPMDFSFFSRLVELWVIWVWGPDLSRATVPHFSCSRCRGPPHTIACFSTPQMAPVMSSTARTSSMVLPAVRATMMFARNCGTVRRGQTGVQMGNHEKDWTPMATTPPNLLFSRNPLDPLHEVQCLHPSGRCLGGG